jgi:hypothetical protein
MNSTYYVSSRLLSFLQPRVGFTKALEPKRMFFLQWESTTIINFIACFCLVPRYRIHRNYLQVPRITGVSKPLSEGGMRNAMLCYAVRKLYIF